MSTKKDFVWSSQSEPHRIRTREILKKHPQIKQLIGKKNPNTFYITFATVALQLGIAWALREQPWWLALVVAYCVGAFASHTLFVCIHEAAHNLIFRKPAYNMWTGILGNLPTIFPTALSFRHFHIKHHAFQGVHELDADLPDFWEARLIRSNFLVKSFWLFMFPAFQGIRTLRIKELKTIDNWGMVNIAVQVVFTAAFVYFVGWTALLYLIASFWFSVGLHPLGARWIQEHFLTLDGEQETYSYYGILNTINLNVGYHNEHHDFPSIPWNLLPEIKRLAPEYYDSLKSHNSFVKLFFLFLFDKEINLFSRIARRERGKVVVSDQSKPDMEMAAAM
jgi:sphingolipid 4-desaturase/C4-monooxygenase